MQNILVVEDDLDIQELLREFLREAGYAVTAAGDGIEAMDLFAKNKYDLILLDIMLPKIDGFGVCELTQREFEVLRELLTHQGRVLTRQNLLDRLCRYDFYGDERVVDTHIKNLRKKLGIDFIQTVRGVGYKIDKENR